MSIDIRAIEQVFQKINMDCFSGKPYRESNIVARELSKKSDSHFNAMMLPFNSIVINGTYERDKKCVSYGELHSGELIWHVFTDCLSDIIDDRSISLEKLICFLMLRDSYAAQTCRTYTTVEIVKYIANKNDSVIKNAA